MKKLAAKWRELLKMDETALGLGPRQPEAHASNVEGGPRAVAELAQRANRGAPRHRLQVLASDAQAPRGRRHAQGEEGEEVSDPDR